MANLKDLFVNGISRFTGKIYASGGIEGNLTGDVDNNSVVTNEIEATSVTADNITASDVSCNNITGTRLSNSEVRTSVAKVTTEIVIGTNRVSENGISGSFTGKGTLYKGSTVNGSEILTMDDVVNNLTSTSKTAPLSAMQGAVINKIKYTYTYIVNSNAALQYWLSNKTAGTSSGGSDFTSVLIKKGIYTISTVYSKTLDTIGTKLIHGEEGSVIKIGYTYTSPGNRYLFSYTDINQCDEIRGVTVSGGVTITASSGSVNGSITYVFQNCKNVSNCTIQEMSMSINSGSGHSITGFYMCNNLYNCSVGFLPHASALSSAYVSCKELNSCYTTSNRFLSCEYLSNCKMNSTTIVRDPGGEAIVFQSCKYLSGCSVELNLSETSQTVSLFSQCSFLVSCSVNFEASSNINYIYAYYNCESLMSCLGIIKQTKGTNSSASIYAFYRCNQVIACRGQAVSNIGNAYAFGSCTQIAFFSPSGHSTTAINASSSSASSTTNTNTPPSNSSNGGFNDISNPA